MNEVDDDLQSFIADCEWKTRKILRESNKRMKDNARTLTAKERVEKLKHGSSGRLGLTTKVNTPLAKSKSLNRSLLKSNPPTPKKTTTPVKAEWKGREKIIQDAYETIKSFPVDKSSLNATAAVRKENQQSEKAHPSIHSSLSASPLLSSKEYSGSLPKAKQKSLRSNSDDDDTPGSGEPAMVTRRTIERDFYIMSKKRNNPPSKRRQRSAKNNEVTPELKTSVLRKKYRCDERLMKSKRKRADRLYEKLKRLKIPSDIPEDLVNTLDGDDADRSDSSVSSDEEEFTHAIHDLVESHISDENARSLKRSKKQLASSTFKLDVKDFWAHLQQNNERTGISDGQVPSVPLHIATRKLDSSSGKSSAKRSNKSQYEPNIGHGPVNRYFSPYKEPNNMRLQLVVNEPLLGSLVGRSIPMTVSISMMYNKASNVWHYEIYDPCNGSTRNFLLTGKDIDSIMTKEVSITNYSRATSFEKVVHHQRTQFHGVESTFVVLVCTDENGISSKIYRSNDRVVDGFDRVCVKENLLSNLQVCGVLQLLRKHHIYSSFDTEFWLNDFNGDAIWKPLIDLCEGNELASSNTLSLMNTTTKAHASLLALKNEMRSSGGIEDFFNTTQQHPSETSGPSSEAIQEAPLSMRILGCSPYSNIVCPGHAPIGKRGVWRLSEPITGEDSDSMFPIWPSLIDTKYPDYLDKSQASAFFQYKALGPQKGNSITVLNSLAFESPILAPYCFATDTGYIAPPFSEHEKLTGIIPHVHLPCTNLLENPVQSRLDTLLPPPVVVLDPSASEDDWKDAPRDAEGHVYHCRESNEFDEDGFRLKTSASRIEYDGAISSRVYGISESAASPNTPAVSPLFTHTSHEACTQPLTRTRNASDYHYIAESDGEGTLNEPYLFATHMGAYSSVFVSRKSISTYREQELFLQAAKEAEQKKLDLALKMKAAEELVEERLKERIAKIEHSVKDQVNLTDTSDNSVAVEIPSCSDDMSILDQVEKIPCDVELPMQSCTEGLDSSNVGEGDELEQLAGLLLKNTNFLKAIAQKLNISEEQIKKMDPMTDNDHSKSLTVRRLNDQKKKDATLIIDEGGGSVSFEETAEPHHTTATNSPAAPESNMMPKLKLNCKRYRQNSQISSRGDGWKKLPRSEIIIGDFSLTKRNVQKGRGGPKFKKLEQNRNFIAVNSVQDLPYQADPEQFQTEPKSLFIPDLTTERLRLAKSYRQQKKANESMLSTSQQQSLNEILQIPVSKTSEKVIDENGTILHVEDDECDEVPPENETRPIDHVAKAVLAVKNHNMPDLEQVLDCEGLSVETRDQHGNTLFILACQQGSKKLAKFLLRRGADMNAQNNGGNTALHYLYEYKHIALAEYLIRKGADDSIKNGDGLTVYEGTQL